MTHAHVNEAVRYLELLLGTEAPAMMPSGVDFSFSFLPCEV